MLRSFYRRPCVDRENLRNPVQLWLAAGGRINKMRRRRIFQVEETKTGEPLEFLIIRQLAAIFEQCLADVDEPAARLDG